MALTGLGGCAPATPSTSSAQSPAPSATATPAPTATPTPLGPSLRIPELGLVMTEPAGLTGLTYRITEPVPDTDTDGHAHTLRTIVFSTARFVAAKQATDAKAGSPEGFCRGAAGSAEVLVADEDGAKVGGFFAGHHWAHAGRWWFDVDQLSPYADGGSCPEGTPIVTAISQDQPLILDMIASARSL
jgi:hypothetical protein